LKRIDGKGFTLIEVVATVAIASLVMVSLVTFFSVVSRVFVASAQESESRLIISSAKAYLKNELTYVAEIDDSGDGTFDKLEFNGGKMFLNGAQVFTDEFYGNSRIYGEVTGLGSVLTFELRIENGGTDRIETYVVKTLNKIDTAISTPTTSIYYK